jgi:hypothetical protein
MAAKPSVCLLQTKKQSKQARKMKQLQEARKASKIARQQRWQQIWDKVIQNLSKK